MSKTIDLYIDQGADFVAVLPPVTDPSGVVVDLTPYTVKSHMRRSYATTNAVELTATLSDPMQGIITLGLGHPYTMMLSPTRYVYDVMITDATGFVTKVFDGLVIVNAGVTGKPSTVLVNITEDEDWGEIPR